MSELSALYQEVILDHNKHPRHYHAMDTPNAIANGFNPLCGDKITLYLKIEKDLIEEASFTGCGCAISTASASLMTEALKGKSINDAHELFHLFHDAIIKQESPSIKLGKLRALLGVKDFPARVKCATLAWHTLENALENKIEPASTE